MIPIFLSRPNPFTNEQSYFIDELITKMTDVQLRNITLEANDYNPYESLTCLCELIKRCYGMIIVAFGQCYIEKGIFKKGAINKDCYFDSYEKSINKMWVTSPFCHIEGAIAFGNHLPILILEQYGLKTDGILKAGDHAIHGPQFQIEDIHQIKAYFSEPTFVSSFNAWYKKVTQLYNFINKIT
ncbi:hypothetical protein DW708_08780 [Ruminococcus sp. AM27-11LB]|uniref:hypothetical protein n=1 Tax=Mediterraneibacter TaxID=2316020 RepID=UPI000E4FDC41|nr:MULTISPECIES: hypothetical protein [Mediterraneibacter]RGH94797.1 hypothetical protein DW719_02465 [Ruminococcus sp. AM27-27]RGH95306.1 hypothetical protein DW708_08780 [Ruminococcus sp. AM27-11LB]